MTEYEKKSLRKQLEEQAKLFTSTADEADLNNKILMTCMSLLKAVQKNHSAQTDEAQFKKEFPKYLGMMSLTEQFMQENDRFIDPEKSISLHEKLQSMEEKRAMREQLQTRKQKLVADLKQADQEYESILEELVPVRESYMERKQSNEQLSEELSEKKNSIEEYDSLNKALETSIAGYDDLKEYLQEMEVTKAGIEREGFVSIESFKEALSDLDQKSNSVIQSYDRILRAVTEDVDELRDQVSKRIRRIQSR